MLAAWTVAWRVESSGFSATVKLPSTSVKRPRTFVPTRWRATKPTSVWAGSMVYVPVFGSVLVLVLVVISVLSLWVAIFVACIISDYSDTCQSGILGIAPGFGGD